MSASTPHRDKIITYGFQAISPGFDRETGLRKGEKLVNHVVKCTEKQSEFLNVVTATVVRQTSIHESVSVSLELDATRTAVNRTCTCAAGQGGVCKHIGAVVAYINGHEGTSKTSKTQTWHQPSIPKSHKNLKEFYAKPRKVMDMFPPQRPKNCPTVQKYKLSPEDLSTDCALYRGVVLLKEGVIAPAPTIIPIDPTKPSDDSLSCVAAFFTMNQHTEGYYGIEKCEVVFENEKEAEYFKNKVDVEESEVHVHFIDTYSQYKSCKWKPLRFPRISASKKAHSIKTRIKNNEKLALSFIGDSKFTGNESTRYGLRHEKTAFDLYASLNPQFKVAQSGLVVHVLQPWLCGSPDAIVEDHDGRPVKLVEFKCPSSCEKTGVYSIINKEDDTIKKSNINYLKIIDGELTLNKSDCYYTQCQLLLYLTGLELCDFFVWSPQNYVQIEIKKDVEFLIHTIQKLCDFYFKYFLPALVQKENS